MSNEKTPDSASRRKTVRTLGALALGLTVPSILFVESRAEAYAPRRRTRRRARRRTRRRVRRRTYWRTVRGARVLVVPAATVAGDVVVVNGAELEVQRREETQIVVADASGSVRSITVVYQ